MADIIFNHALGFSRAFIQNVEDNVPAGCLLRIHAWVHTATDATIRDIVDANIDDIQGTALIAEATNGGYGFTALDATDITITIDLGADNVDIGIADQTDAAVMTGDNWTAITLSYDSSGADSDIVTKGLWWLVFVVVPNGGDITVNFPAVSFRVTQL